MGERCAPECSGELERAVRGGGTVKRWIERSFRSRIFLTVLLAALVPLLLCDLLMTRVMIVRSERLQAAEAR